MLRRHASGFRAMLMLADAGIAFVLLVVLSILRFGSENWLDVWGPLLEQPAVVAVGYSVAWVIALWLHGLYRPRARWTIRSEGVAIARATVVLGLVTGTVLFAFRLPDVSRLFLLLLFPAQWVVTLATRIGLRVAFEWLRARGFNTRYMLVVGAGPRAQAFASKLEDHRELGLRILGFVDDEFPGDLPRGWRYLGPVETIENLLHNEVIDEVALCLPFSEWDRMNAIAHLCEEEGKIVRVPVVMLERALTAGRFEEIDGTPVYSLVNGPDRIVALVVKRIVDIAFAGTALVIGSPLLAAIALSIRLRDGAPVLFRQERIGLHGRRFQMLKFRTMSIDAEQRLEELRQHSEVDVAFKMTNDPRVTRSGRFLRRISLDELPQLWNVLRGDMSLVGPRPALPREVETYDLWHRRRLSMKPGITGLWQVEARQDESFDRRASLDLNYIDRWSVWLDMRIMIRTIPALLQGR